MSMQLNQPFGIKALAILLCISTGKKETKKTITATKLEKYFLL